MKIKTNLDDRVAQSHLKIIEDSGLTPHELRGLLKRDNKKESKRARITFSGNRIRYGYFSDPHIGQREFREDLFLKMCKFYRKEGVDFIITPGDHLEGMSGREGQVYELTHIGFSQQIKYATELYNELPAITYGIDGNHDGWFKKKNNGGIIVGEELEQRVKLYNHLGENEADVDIGKGVTIKLFHANDGTAYAMSYKLQKLIESFSGGEKPNILHSGHYHKSLYMFLRNVHGFESGTLCGQTEWMRGKKIPAHVGFGMVDVWVKNRGVERLTQTFFPEYY